ncbi:MAG TPA: hypothetical protein VF599_12500 [Pyrinomonadaceae bacterium]|jgi:poly [ADP-ribose] polymerase
MTVIKQYKMNYFDAGENSNKVWIGSAHDNGLFEAQYGRVREGANLAVSKKQLSSSAAAVAYLESKRGEKLRKGYEDTSVLGGAETEIVITNNRPQELSRLAVEQILGDGALCATTADLIKYLAEVNIHQITHSTSIKYNAATGAFSTPLGVLTPEAVAKARQLLTSIESENSNGLTSGARHKLICDYFRLVPADFGARIPPSSQLLDTADKISAQGSILDALDAALTTSSPDLKSDKIFKCKLSIVPHTTDEGRAVFRRIKKQYESSKNGFHNTSSLKLVRVYEVEIEDMKQNFDLAAAKIGNVRADLWHGTKASNLLSILKSGLMIPKSSASHCTGRMFGDGIYTSVQSTKALNYATDFWNGSGARNQRTFMFLTECALGKMNEPKNRTGSFPRKGFDSTWVEAGTCGVMNHEAIVYDTSQINLKYLCEFGAV